MKDVLYAEGILFCPRVASLNRTFQIGRAIKRLLFRQVFFGSADARYKNGDQFVVFLDQWIKFFHRLDQWFSLDNQKPDEGLSQLILSDFHLVDEIFTRLRTLRFAIIRSRRCA